MGGDDKSLQKNVPFTDARDHVTAYETETQLVDIDYETQMLNLYSETEEVNLDNETQFIGNPDCIDTQLLDYADDDVAADSDDDTQLLDHANDGIAADSDDDGTDRTKELVDDGELFDNDSLSRDTAQSSGKVNILHQNNNLAGDKENGSVRSSEVLIKEGISPGHVGGFTSVRAAAFRASGLAARDACPKVPHSESRSILTNCHSSDRGTADNDTSTTECYAVEEVDQLHNEKRSANKTARKLFDDDNLSEPEENSQNMLMPLSYVDSQEPGEASQANALNFVDRFINDNCLGFQDELVHGKSSDEKSKHHPSVRGLQILAKKAGNISGAKGAGLFDWDDNRENEGGGDILSRRKEELFGDESGGRRSLAVLKEPRGKLQDGCGKKNELADSVGKVSSLSGMESEKNPVKELEGQLKCNDAETHIYDEVLDVGPDTQIAAEAIEALNCGYWNNLGDDNGSVQDVQLKNKSSEMENELPSSEESDVCDLGVKRPSKRTKGTDNLEILKRGTKRARSIPVKVPQKKMEGLSKDVQLDSTSKSERCKSKRSKNKVFESTLSNKSSEDWMIMFSSYPKRKRSKLNLQRGPYESGMVRDSAVGTPVKSIIPVNNPSPICIGDEYLEQSCKNPSKSFSSREICHLTVPQLMLDLKSTRKRRDLGSIHVLFSQHLDEDVTKHLKKIMVRLGISEASCMTKATHFVADKFARTRNMLEAIASGKHVVTPLWLDSIGQVKIYIDEEGYILRDAKKEKEFGFSMPFSLAHARQHPLLQGRKVFVTPNTKPGKETIRTLVKAVHGQAVERLGRSVMKEYKVADNLLVLSCQEDFNVCVPFLERGMEVYSSELLLNGIVTQKLEYERHRLFADHVKRTRSTIWLRDNQSAFL